MKHPLDNPAWSALISGNADLADGTDEVKYFDKAVSPFAGLIEDTSEYLHKLFELIPHNGPVGVIDQQQLELPGEWALLQAIPCLQMIYDGNAVNEAVSNDIIPLTGEHIPQMLELTRLTNPGPFAARTIDFGHYHGIFDGGKLVAMAGQRMHILNHAEISAVCTHPDYLGRGYAKKLLNFHAKRIKLAGEVPILHVKGDNHRAIAVYKSVGFAERTKLWFHIIKKGTIA